MTNPHNSKWLRWQLSRLRPIKLLFHRIAAFAAIASLVLTGGLPAQAASDITAPDIVSAAMVSGAELVSDQTNQNTYFDLVTHDGLSGMSGAPLVFYTSPTGKQTTGATAFGSYFDGTNVHYNIVVNWLQYQETGTWTPAISLRDVSGNSHTYTNIELQAMGYDLRVTLTGTGDTTPETLDHINLTSSRSQDVSASNGVIYNFDGQLLDNLAGPGTPTLLFTSPSGQQSKTTTFYLQPDPIGSFVAFTEFPQYSETGTWLPTMTLIDAVGNSIVLTNADLLARGIDLHLVLTGTTDVTPPTLEDINIGLANPVVDNVANGGAVVTLYAAMSDNLAGMGGNTSLVYTSHGGQIAEATLTSITASIRQYTTFLPPYSESGVWEPTLTLGDSVGNTTVLNGTQLAAMGFPITLNVTKNITKAAAANETVTSDEENDGATPTDPVEVAVTTPNAGDVSIVIVASDAVSDPTNGYTFFDRQMSIVAPGASVENPLTLEFTIDASKIPNGESANTLQITRNGEALAACVDQTTANPDGCVFSRTTLTGGDILVKVHSTHASAWASGFPSHNSDAQFRGFKSPTLNYPAQNNANSGSAVPVKFKVMGAIDTSFMAAGYPNTQKVNCTTLAPIGSAIPALSTKNGFKKTGKYFEYTWKTQKDWNDSCRLFTVKIDGEAQTHSALFKLK